MRGLQNQSALGDPNWKSHVYEADLRAQRHGIQLQLPPKLKAALEAPRSSTLPEKPLKFESSPALPEQLGEIPKVELKKAGSSKNLPEQCGWLNGLWVNINGSLGACCVNQKPKMGNIYDGPLWENEDYLSVKKLFAEGKVFPSCMKVLNSCSYLSMNKQAGIDVEQWLIPEFNRKPVAAGT